MAKPPTKLRVFPPTRPEDVRGSLPYNGQPKTLEEMDAGVLAEAKRRYERVSAGTTNPAAEATTGGQSGEPKKS